MTSERISQKCVSDCDSVRAHTRMCSFFQHKFFETRNRKRTENYCDLIG